MVLIPAVAAVVEVLAVQEQPTQTGLELLEEILRFKVPI